MPVASSELHALLHLLAIGGSLAARRRLLELTQSAHTACTAGARIWGEAGLDRAQCQALLAVWSPADEVIRWLDGGPERRILGWHDADYPPLLRDMPDPPLALFVAGDPLRLWHPALAMVGSRMPTAGGCGNARTFAAHLVHSGLAITSGLAAGIDGAAHHAALEAGGVTIAVLGTGIDTPYPRAHAQLYRDIASTGAVVSEYPPGAPGRRAHFPARNRIIAGLSLGTLVVEAAHRSGALITARLACEAGREVFAIPGSIHNPMAKGCHRLIRQGAALVEDPAELSEVLVPLAARLGQAVRQRLDDCLEPAVVDSSGFVPSDPEIRRVWQALGHDPVALDQLAERTGLSVAVLSSLLLSLELEGRIVARHGRYCRHHG